MGAVQHRFRQPQRPAVTLGVVGRPHHQRAEIVHAQLPNRAISASDVGMRQRQLQLRHHLTLVAAQPHRRQGRQQTQQLIRAQTATQAIDQKFRQIRLDQPPARLVRRRRQHRLRHLEVVRPTGRRLVVLDEPVLIQQVRQPVDLVVDHQLANLYREVRPLQLVFDRRLGLLGLRALNDLLGSTLLFRHLLAPPLSRLLFFRTINLLRRFSRRYPHPTTLMLICQPQPLYLLASVA